jgi:hypothetical protein
MLILPFLLAKNLNKANYFKEKNLKPWFFDRIRRIPGCKFILMNSAKGPTAN